MISLLNNLRGAFGLNRLIALHDERRFLFHGRRSTDPSLQLFPWIQAASTDPERVRGFFVPSIGLIPPKPLVGHVFPNPVVAAAVALMQTLDGVCAMRTDDYSDGSVAIFLGENQVSQGGFEQLLVRTAGQIDATPLGGYGVDVVDKRLFAGDRHGFPMPGCYISYHPVPVMERVPLTVGDARVVATLFRRLPAISFSKGGEARRDPFTGVFSAGGHLEFDGSTGTLVSPRVPTEADRRSSLRRAQLRGSMWLKRTTGKPLDEGFLERGQPVESPLSRAVRFIEDHCAEPISIAAVSEVAELSARQLRAVFQQVLGCTPLEYASEKRLDLAERLIVETELSVGSIAQRCGFAEQASLSRSLKRRRGLTPMEVRKNARIQDRI